MYALMLMRLVVASVLLFISMGMFSEVSLFLKVGGGSVLCHSSFNEHRRN